MTELRLEKVGTNQKRQAKKLLNKTPNSGLNKYGEVQTALLKEESSGASRIENYGSKSKFLKLQKNKIDENSEQMSIAKIAENEEIYEIETKDQAIELNNEKISKNKSQKLQNK